MGLRVDYVELRECWSLLFRLPFGFGDKIPLDSISLFGSEVATIKLDLFCCETMYLIPCCRVFGKIRRIGGSWVGFGECLSQLFMLAYGLIATLQLDSVFWWPRDNNNVMCCDTICLMPRCCRD